MSLFAWSGIRAKWHGYYYLDSNGTKQLPAATNPPTHTGIWALWNEWVTRPDIKTLLSQSIKLHPAITFDKVVKAINFAQPGQALKSWGADLLNISDDHAARNAASYNATWIDTPLSQMKEEEAEIVRELWQLLLSDGSSLGFDSSLCSHFAEQAVERTHIIAGKSRDDIRLNIAQHISNNTGLPVDDVLRRLDPTLYSSRPFLLAASADTKPQNVLCRSFLLLRMALLAMKTSLSLPSIPETAKKWLENWLEHAGIWSAGTGMDLLDIEIDYRDAVSDLEVARPLPATLWQGENSTHIMRIARPDACIAWSLVA
ncbi:hypothetical protein DRB87_15050 [Pandoraea sp. XY-2]|nr:hypothetical protein DRB87_15050 [Pandoraea sp. XY-2]